MAHTSCMTLAFCECAENHVGNQQLGEMAAEGWSVEELVEAKTRFEAAGATTV